MAGIGAVAEPLIVIALLISGTWINRDFAPGRRRASQRPAETRRVSDESANRHEGVAGTIGDEEAARSSSPSLLGTQEPKWRKRDLSFWGLKTQVTTPNTRKFRGYVLSRLLERLPFLVECWYWALIYWVYQLGRAATAVWIVEATIVAAENHALQLIALEQKLHMFWELDIQKFFMKNVFMMTWINRTYSFIHIPGSIAFLIWLFYYTNTRNRLDTQDGNDPGHARGSPAGPQLYESRRRTMAFCNLLAFIIFTIWPCMPPRLLSADTSDSETGELARSYGFVDTVHGPYGEGSIWTDNRFTNKFAAMPSLHFGYSLLIGLTIATIPLNKAHGHRTSYILPFFNRSHPNLAPKIRVLSWRRCLCIFIGTLYPATILLCIIATANHFILDAVAGACVCGVAWWGNDVLLNLLALEDWFLWVVRIHKPRYVGMDVKEDELSARELWKD
ncbi:hypothetical protein BP5796_03210 [Coleophoma crateriformis]|uniref:Inositolphosphotransferase Aur1/Ipt1 domain-containing protein n=1 Tax=Coleophoma crateriformis TaxID=565419 RepID=A0A3D8SMK8_9HELO|nr:hypothetical protein BP5796_03210 [Coleophoma crateriformis]